MNANFGFVAAKADKQRTSFLPLPAHCLDVAIVFRQLVALGSIRHRLGTAIGTDLTDAQLDRLAIIAGLHDIGKANLGFQRRLWGLEATDAGHIRELEIVFEEASLRERFVAALSAERLCEWFSGDVGFESMLLAVWSHHGKPLVFQGQRVGLGLAKRWWQNQSLGDPMKAVAEVMAWLTKAFPAAFEHAPGIVPSPSFQHLFAGLVMLADWLGSHPEWFPVRQMAFAERLEHSRRAAAALVRAVGMDVADLKPTTTGDFEDRFGFAPRSCQRALDKLDPDDPAHRLLILEAETGSGKTEAALAWFFKLFVAGKVGGLYFALPTRVAARELYQRIAGYIRRWFPDPERRPVTVLAVPGYSQVDDLPPRCLLPDAEQADLWHDEAELRRRERAWAAERPKRYLAGTVAVGTIDQALLAVVQTGHAHLRWACLSRSLLVVDEVHASDMYMGKLLEHLLRNHFATGGFSLLLSATLGSRAKQEFLHAVGNAQAPAPPPSGLTPAPYPALSFSNGKVEPIPSASSKKVRFELQPLAFSPEKILPRVQEALSKGARVLVILNTVSRTNALLRALESQLDDGWLFQYQGIKCPHHGRFAPCDRSVLDAAVSVRFGKTSRPGPILLIGTQTLEQSLDLDADLLITDLAPADVLLQRVGRLHRHERRRPPGFERPRCIVLVPDGDLSRALDNRGQVLGTYRRLGLGSVYEDLRILELTRLFLQHHSDVEIPKDNRRFIEATTHPQQLASLRGEQWQRHGQEVEGGELMQAIAAGQVLVDFSKPFGELKFHELGERVRTRLAVDSLELPLDKPFVSPFGQTVTELVIPGHLKPQDPSDCLSFKKFDGERAIVGCGSRLYCYSRFGLEVYS